jgi:alpha-1,3-rhamnosyl/mannosyltransferase
MTAQKILFDARMARASGIGTYTRGLMNALARRPENLEYCAIVSAVEPVLTPWPSFPVKAGMYSMAEQIQVPRAFRASRAALLHSPHYNVPVSAVRRCVVTVHDLIHLKFPQFLPSLAARLYANAMFRWVIPKARAILTVSEHTRKDLIETLKIPPEKITVTPPGVTEGFQRISPEIVQPILRSLEFPESYFLYVGNLKEFKNVPMLLEVFGRFQERHPDGPRLVMVGRNLIDGFDRRIQQAKGVHWLPSLAGEILPKIYSGALAFLFPSLYEGFGLPPLEAMACGAPVICSNRASLPEVVGEAAIFIDPERPDSLLHAMEQIAQDSALRQHCIEKGLKQAARFSWDRTAAATVEVYRRCLD